MRRQSGCVSTESKMRFGRNEMHAVGDVVRRRKRRLFGGGRRGLG